MSELSLIQILNKALDDFSSKEMLQRPKIILVNPATRKALIYEWQKYFVSDILKEDNDAKECMYMGIPIYRSPDVEENKFLIL